MEVAQFLKSISNNEKIIVSKTSKVGCTYYLQCQLGIRESDKMDLIGLKAYRLFMEIMNYVYSNDQPICIDLKFRKHLQKELEYGNLRNINRLIKILVDNDFLGVVEMNIYRVNPLASFKGSYKNNFKGAIERYYKSIETNTTKNQAMLTAYLQATDKEWNDLTRI